MKNILRTVALLLAVTAIGAFAETSGAGRYDQDIAARVEQKLANKRDLRGLDASVDDGIVTLTGTVDLYQQKLDAAKQIKKLTHVTGVRNLIEVGSTVADADLTAKLDRKLYYDRMGYDNRFNYVTASVQDGVVTLSGLTRTDVGRDSAVGIANSMSGVKEVVNDIRIASTSNFDDDIRIRVTLAIYHDPVLSRYATDPAAPIRIVVDKGKLTLYGTVESTMDKDIAGIRANQVFGVFSVANNLSVVKGT